MYNHLETIINNRFDMSEWREGFTDRFSHMTISAGKRFLQLKNLSPRGLIEWREPMAEPLAELYLPDNKSGREYRVYLHNISCLPWKFTQKGGVFIDAQNNIEVNAVLSSAHFNVFNWVINIEHGGVINDDKMLLVRGRLKKAENNHMLKAVENGLMCCFNPCTEVSGYQQQPQLDGTRPVWALRTAKPQKIYINENTGEYEITVNLSDCCTKTSQHKSTIILQIDYSNVSNGQIAHWNPGTLYSVGEITGENKKREAWWKEKIESASEGPGDTIRKVRCCCGLVRNGYLWRTGGDGNDVVASYCTMTSWASTAFFWDTLNTIPGLAQFSIELAKDALKTAFLKQRSDGCVPTNSYEFLEGSTFYPQSPTAAYALVKILQYETDREYIRYMLPKIDKLFDWFIKTQDHDGDGLMEWRYSGCPGTDNSPLYDHYARPAVGAFLGESWCTYLPPVASVSLNSFLIMEAKCLAFLHKTIGNRDKSQVYLAVAGELEEKLKEICFYNNTIFFDYDHHIKKFNKAVTLFSFLPVWAGINIERNLRNEMIEKYLLSDRYFFNEYPFPFLSVSEEGYRPDGYWRGRIWPHTTIWMLEVLWACGYHREADMAADRLLNMMSQDERMLENYYSSPLQKGGGEPDYNWSFSSCIQLENRLYRKPVLDILKESL